LCIDDLSGIRKGYSPQAAWTPYIFAAIYDPRIDLANALDCGLVALTEIPALASNTFTVIAQKTVDTLGMIPAPETPEICAGFYASTLSKDDEPYLSYSFHLSTMVLSNISLCDSSNSPTTSCVSQAIIRFGSHVVNEIESKHSIEKTDILINEGAIVGAIQFFAWFFGILSS
jgi:hypothetical protein